ncbi:unnamed protein product [Candida verbasci]|uniref:tRNA (guanine(37)-N1)-methyltransferase n=1 Tax=Candida verbasci TaxID=1227364 RepID=A0A9W4XMN7_9ASCO|nr:unnamed protein product [Candida verbasci]
MNRFLFNKLPKSIKRSIIMTKYSPPINRSMKDLDTSFFKKEIPLLLAFFPQPKFIGLFQKSCKSDILNIDNIKPIINLRNSKAILLNDSTKSINDLSIETQNLINQFNIKLEPYLLKLDYSFWKSDEILSSILPESLLHEIPTGFSQAGHLAHLNLKDEYKPYGKVIGQVLLDKNTSVKTVVNKLDSIENKFRTFPLELLAGEPNYLVEQKECNCKFKFDFSKVYWNSRLSTEHERISNKFKKGDLIGDVMAGVGPFAIPSAKNNKSLVLANDLNPESFKYLNENIKLNKVDSLVKSFNLDGREFIKNAFKLLKEWHISSNPIQLKSQEKVNNFKSQKIEQIEIPKFFHHFVMNLPDSALSFVKEFIGLYQDEPQIKNLPNFKLPYIHVYTFIKFDQSEIDIITDIVLHKRLYDQLIELLDYKLNFEDIEFHKVRMVSPTKPMYCISFELPEDVAFRNIKQT